MYQLLYIIKTKAYSCVLNQQELKLNFLKEVQIYRKISSNNRIARTNAVFYLNHFFLLVLFFHNDLQFYINFFLLSKHLCHKEQSLQQDRKSTRLNSSHVSISYAVFCLKKK